MRLSTDESRDEELALATIAAAADAGITLFDTARAYGDNERLLALGLRRCGAGATARIVTKAGMKPTEGRWIPDGRARTIRTDCEASLSALDGLPIDLLLAHAPDPRTPWATTVRALARLVDEGLVRRIGVANVNRRQLDEALELAPVAAVEVALSLVDDRAVRGGVVERCAELGVTVIAHSPLGGPRRVRALLRHEALNEVAAARGATAAEVALAWLLGLAPVVLPIPGARRPETARSAARAATLELTESERATLDRAFAASSPAPRRRRGGRAGELVLVMGVPGAGKTRLAEAYLERGYIRLNRDERGGSLRELAGALEEVLAAGARRVVLDNTYLTRASRSYVVEAAARHGLPARCVWLDTPLAQAQVNLVERLLDRFSRLPAPEELREVARREPGLHTPTSQMRTVRELEPPAADEGFAAVERVPFERAPRPGRAGFFVAAAAPRERGWKPTDPNAPHLVFDWSPEGGLGELPSVAAEIVELALCPHGGGPPVCWCRPPLPGLPLAFARAHGVDPARSTLVGTSAAHKTLAATLGARFVEA
jgi:aryl-alcohol dehydrogenase-like predicted oxidoreductase/predicted kinase